MTKSQMFNEAHKTARLESRRFGISYRKAFSNALYGFHAVANGYRGIELAQVRA